MHETRIDLPARTRTKVIESLNARLAEAIDLGAQAKHAHWNVKGPNFIALHELFDKVAEAVEEHIDELAERITALGGTAHGTIATAARASSLPPYPEQVSEGLQHVDALATALAHMQSQLEGLEDARRRFIATASHELRTPIFSLGGFLELIQDEELDEDTRRQFVGQVREQVARLGKLATGLLDLSRLEAGSVDLEPTPTDLGVLSRAVAAEFVPALSLHQSELDLKLPETPLRAVVDPDRVAQLLRILIDNAITHTPDGTKVIVGVGDGNDMVRLSVTDNGPGIPEDTVGRIFEPFYSADGVQGAGLGLAIARELAERLHGVLDVRSGGGATVFTLTLPGEEA